MMVYACIGPVASITLTLKYRALSHYIIIMLCVFEWHIIYDSLKFWHVMKMEMEECVSEIQSTCLARVQAFPTTISKHPGLKGALSAQGSSKPRTFFHVRSIKKTIFIPPYPPHPRFSSFCFRSPWRAQLLSLDLGATESLKGALYYSIGALCWASGNRRVSTGLQVSFY